jgi:hypothetical protein
VPQNQTWSSRRAFLEQLKQTQARAPALPGNYYGLHLFCLTTWGFVGARAGLRGDIGIQLIDGLV